MNVAVKKTDQYAALVGDRSILVHELELRRILADCNRLLKERATATADAMQLHTIIGMCYSRLARHESALESYKRALNLMPNLPAARVNVGVAMMDCGDIAGAAMIWAEAVEAPDGRSVVAFSNLAEALMASGLRDEAWASFNEAVQLADPANRHDTFILAHQAAELGADAEATEFFARHMSIRIGKRLDGQAGAFLRSVPQAKIDEALENATAPLRSAILRSRTLDVISLPNTALSPTDAGRDRTTSERVYGEMAIYRRRANAATLPPDAE